MVKLAIAIGLSFYYLLPANFIISEHFDLRQKAPVRTLAIRRNIETVDSKLDSASINAYETIYLTADIKHLKIRKDLIVDLNAPGRNREKQRYIETIVFANGETQFIAFNGDTSRINFPSSEDYLLWYGATNHLVLQEILRKRGIVSDQRRLAMQGENVVYEIGAAEGGDVWWFDPVLMMPKGFSILNRRVRLVFGDTELKQNEGFYPIEQNILTSDGLVEKRLAKLIRVNTVLSADIFDLKKIAASREPIQLTFENDRILRGFLDKRNTLQ